jgi:N-acetylmuramoyl-L-alanine amidase
MRASVLNRPFVRRAWLASTAGLFVAAALVPARAAPGIAVQGLALAGTADEPHLVIDLAAPSKATVFTLDHPDRVVVDLGSVVFDARRVRIPAAAGPVRRIRVGPRDSGALRIVLDLDRRLKARALPDTGDGRRLVIALGSTAAALAAAPSEPAPAAPARIAPAPTRDLVIAVDAGHGGDDPGATGRDGTREKTVTLAIARALAARINAEPGMRSVLTRDGDYFVELPDRVKRAHDAKADLFVSVHADAIADRSITGASVYVLSARGASSETAKLLADRENAAVLIGAPLPDHDDVVASVVVDLVKSAAMNASMEAAGKVLDQLNEVGEVRKATVQQAGFVVLKAAAMPSMLIESAYITNPGEERRLRDPRHQAQVAEAILSGLRSYFREYPPPGTRMAALVAAAGTPSNGALGAPGHALQR